MSSIKQAIRNNLHDVNAQVKFKYKNIPEVSKELTKYIYTLDLMLFGEPQAAEKYMEDDEVMK